MPKINGKEVEQATLRDQFAMAALAGYDINDLDRSGVPDLILRRVARDCYILADAMLVARGQS